MKTPNHIGNLAPTIEDLQATVAEQAQHIIQMREALQALQRQVLQGATRGDEWMDEALELTRTALHSKKDVK